MKRVLMVAVLGFVAVGGVAYSRHVQASEVQVDEALVNAKVDARLRQVLGELRQRTTSRAEGLAVVGR